MQQASETPIDWFWAHRRNASLHHFSFLMSGLAGTGWQPVVDFWFDNQIIIGVPGKGCYVFYDKRQLASGAKFKDVQQSIDRNPEFVRDFKRRTEEIFGAIFFTCIKIEEENLSLLSTAELAGLYDSFIRAIMVAPIITVQLWGIEACFDEEYRIMRFLRSRLQELGRLKDFQFYKEMLSVNVGETVAFTEQKNFYQAATALDTPEMLSLFADQDIERISERLREFGPENEIFEKHIAKYEWVHTEYVSGGWPRTKWVALFREALLSDERPRQRLEKLLASFGELVRKRDEAIELLDPPADVLHALDALSELIAQRDWTKGYFTKILLSYHLLLGEIAKRMGRPLEELFSVSYLEVESFLDGGEVPSEAQIAERRAEGFAIVIKHGSMSVYEGRAEVDRIIQEEGIAEPFEQISAMSSFKGLGASRGVIQAKARVIEDASRLSELQEGEILITYMTTIEFTPAFRRAAGVVTDEGGMSCHAAIISREFKLPCVVGTRVATRAVQTGDMLEVDGALGTVRIVESAEPTKEA